MLCVVLACSVLQAKIDVIALTSPNDAPITFPAEPEVAPAASPSEGEGASESKGGEEGEEEEGNPPVVVAAAAIAAPVVAGVGAEVSVPQADGPSAGGADTAAGATAPVVAVVVPAAAGGVDVGTPTAASPASAGEGAQESKAAELVEVTLEYVRGVHPICRWMATWVVTLLLVSVATVPFPVQAARRSQRSF